MTRIATISSFLNPSPTAIGKKTAANPTSFITAATIDGLAFAEALWISKVAPIAISPIGVAMFPILVTVFAGIPENGRRHADQRSPTTIPIIIGLVIIPFKVFFNTSLSILLCPGLKTDSTTTAIIL